MTLAAQKTEPTIEEKFGAKDRLEAHLRVTLGNSYLGKDAAQSTIELDRYTRFFGSEAVTDSTLSFAEFSGDPGAILGRARG